MIMAKCSALLERRRLHTGVFMVVILVGDMLAGIMTGTDLFVGPHAIMAFGWDGGRKCMVQNMICLLERNFSDENDSVFLWVAFVAVNAIDVVTTNTNVNIYGSGVEMNPMIRLAIEQWGLVGIVGWKVFWIVPMIAIGFNFLKYRAVLLLNIILLGIVYGNVFFH